MNLRNHCRQTLIWVALLTLVLAGLGGLSTAASAQTSGAPPSTDQGQEKQPAAATSDVYVPNIYFTGDPPPFSRDWLMPPTSATATYLDPVGDHDEIVRAQRVLKEELTRYPQSILQQNLLAIYVVKSLSEEGIEVGGLNSPEDKKLYLADNGYYDESTEKYLRLSVHHEFAHLLLDTYATHFSRSQWESLNPATFHYGKGGLDNIRENPDAGADLDPASWEEGFAYPYGKSDLDEDFACMSEAVFFGDANFWQAVDRIPILNNKVKMVIAFYNSLDSNLTEAYFRQLKPFPSATDPSITPHYPEDTRSYSAPPYTAMAFLGVFFGGGFLLVLCVVIFAVINARPARRTPAEPPQWLSTQLWQSVMLDDVGRIENALMRGADVNACDTNGNAILAVALAYGHPEAARALLRYRPYVNVAIQQTGMTPLMGACRIGARDMVETLLAGGASINMQAHDGAFALGYAAYGGYQEIVFSLLQRGANPHLTDRYGNTALSVARQQFEVARDPIRKEALFRIVEALNR